jgi:transposase InsO family protein
LAGESQWLRRFRATDPTDQTVIFGHLPRPKTPFPAYPTEVETKVLSIRDEPPAHLQRIPGPKAILYFLHHDPELQALALPLPRSTRTIWKILRKHDRLLSRSPHQPEELERPAPLIHWQIDFKDASTVPADPYGKQQHVVEILNVVDVGTSMVLDSHVHTNFHAQTALQAMAQTFQSRGVPAQVTLDRDTRWMGSPSEREFPSAFLRFLLCLGITPDICPPHRPQQNGVVERYHRNVKYECLLVHHPQTEEEVRRVNREYVQHYNSERPSQALPCGNRPPTLAFPTLPILPPVPEQVDPDAWLDQVHGLHTVRKVRTNGSILLDDVPYYIKGALAGQYVDVSINATTQMIEVGQKGQLLKQLAIKGLKHTLVSYAAFAEAMAEEALAEYRKSLRRQRRGRSQAV